MTRRVEAYVAVICVMALASIAGVIALSPPNVREHLPSAACFAALGVLAHMLAHRLPRGASGSIAFLPFLAIVLVTPSWAALLAVGGAMASVELFNGKQPIKSVFNVAQVTLAVATCVIVYQLLGGEPLRDRHDVTLMATISFSIGFLLFVLVNTFAVSGVIGVSEGRPLLQIWRSNTRRSLVYDLLSLPFVFVFAVIYLEYGIGGAAILALQMLGVRQLYKTNWQLAKTNQDLLQLMVAAIEARDPYTSGHSRRVAQYSRVIARAIGLPSRQVDRIEIAALLHDVGKIHENFAPILRKPSRLTPEEAAIMQTHPLKSAELVEHVTEFRDLVEIVRHHHENWDGSGYPSGLCGQEIPLGARVIIFADTVDAMTSDRPYRAALGETQVRAELRRMRGIQFDPQICDTLLSSPLFHDIFRTQPRGHSTATEFEASPVPYLAAAPPTRAVG